MNILFLGVIMGKTGRRAAARFISKFTAENNRPELIIVNGDHATEGSGLTGDTAGELLGAGADIITLGQNVWGQADIESVLDKRPDILRPFNLPGTSPGRGTLITEVGIGRVPVGIINISGYTFIGRILPDNPFPIIHDIVKDVSARTRVTVMDFFAVPTAEKAAMRYHLDGMISLLVGTGTHVQTADEQISKTGTASITDVGMVGAYDSVVGFEKDGEIKRFTTSMKSFPRTAEGRARVDAVLCEVDPDTGWALSIKRISEIIET
ncbi:MAG: YmdB family metallophosphoesterase [Deltaproteobacteria bacterium]|nr:YmdB family metallophosphoesterase [Candidatus Zymogenaceae bacterium]